MCSKTISISVLCLSLGQPSGTADTETEPNNSSIVASPSQSIIMPSKSMTTDKTEHTDRETSEKRQEEQQQTEEIEGSLELVKDGRGEGRTEDDSSLIYWR